MKNSYRLIVLCLCLTALLLTGCRTKQGGTSGGGGIVTQVDSHKAQAQRIQAKVSMAARIDGRGLTLSGTMRMERNKIIQISIVPLGLIEAGVMEFTPEGVLMVYRIGHQYVRASYDDVPLLRDNGVDFNAIQALFWGELFAPGKKVCSADDFDTQVIGQSTVLSTRNNRDIMVKFVTGIAGGAIRQTQVTAPEASYTGATLNWKYKEHTPVGNGSLPTSYEMTVENTSHPASCDFTLSRVKTDPEWGRDIRTTVDASKYKELRLDNLMSSIMKLSL